jgi:DUF4097 and DUF4098 domain-containing protein YvlB
MRHKICTTWTLCTVVGAALASAATIDRTYRESFAAAPGTVLELHHDDGDVDVQPWAEDRVEVVARYHAVIRGLGGPRDYEVDFEQRGDLIRVVGREVGSNFSFGGTRTYEHSFTVRAPAWVALRLRGDDGDVTVRSWEAAIDVEVNDGHVRIDGLRGDLDLTVDDGDVDLFECVVSRAEIRLQDGDLRLDGGAGEWVVRLDDGDFEARDLAASRLDVEAQDGDLDIVLSAAPAPTIDLRADDGNISLAVPPDLAVDFSITVDDGDMRVTLAGATVESRDSHVTRGRMGAGGAGTIRIVTQDGDVTLRGTP